MIYEDLSSDGEDTSSNADFGKWYKLTRLTDVKSKKFKIHNRVYKVEYEGLGETILFGDTAEALFDHILQDISSIDATWGQTFTRIALQHPGLLHEIYLPFSRSITGKDIVLEAMKVQQSRTEFQLDKYMTLNVLIAEVPSGSGRTKKILTPSEFSHKSTAVIHVKESLTDGTEPDHHLCCPIALVLGQIYLSQPRKEDSEDYHNWKVEWTNIIRDFSFKKRITKAHELCQRAQVDPKTPCDLKDLQKFQDVLKDKYRIVVYSDNRQIIFSGNVSSNENLKTLYLFYYDRHYNFIKNVAVLFRKRKHCDQCRKMFSNYHRCSEVCPKCNSPGVCETDFATSRQCIKCNRTYKNDTCFRNHIENKHCENFTVCTQCSAAVFKLRDHKCNSRYCSICNVKYTAPCKHKCFIQPITDEDTALSKPTRFIFFDIETFLDHDNKHIPILVVAQTACELCIISDTSTACTQCNSESFMSYEQSHCIDRFCSWLIKLNNKLQNGSPPISIVAHNAGKYDLQFIIDYFVDLAKAFTAPKIVQKGTKIMFMEFGQLRFVDSFNFISLPLAKMPETFGVSQQKGFFPHRFAGAKTLEYKGEYPDPYFYEVHKLAPEKQQEFFQWYNENCHKIFDFREEMIKYCKQDVNVLRVCCGKYRELFIEQTGVCPMSETYTLASTCLKIFRKNFLKPEQIAVNVNPPQAQSIKAEQWLEFMSHKHNVQIQHIFNSDREMVIHGRKVDGFDCQNNVIYSFLGCYFHACEKHFPDQDALHPQIKKPFREIREETERIISEQKMYFRVEAIWECDFDKMVSTNEEGIKDFLQTVEIEAPLQPRDSLYGGRTETFHHFAEPNGEDEEIRFIDINSLYPYICKTGVFPVGHPTVIKKFENCNIDSFVGLIKCSVLPPRNLFHPVLPYRTHSKLVFTLCRTCAETNDQSVCTHDDSERLLKGTWVSLEIQAALNRGYEIHKIYEVWHYEQTTQYNPETNNAGIFSEYINTFLKLKMEASGWPTDCDSATKRSEFLQEFKDIEGCELNPLAIESNPGLRFISKACLNSLWGKLSQRTDFEETKLMTNPEEYFELWRDPKIKLTNAILLNNDECLYVTFKRNKGYEKHSKNASVVPAAFVTAQARLKLLEYLEVVGERSVYCDTDSLVYRHSFSKSNPLLGRMMGCMTNDLKKGETSLKCFYSTGAKSYAYCVKETGRLVCKVKGINLNTPLTNTVNINSIRDLILQNIDILHSSETDMFVRNKHFEIHTEKSRKQVSLTMDKRKIEVDLGTVPFGYRESDCAVIWSEIEKFLDPMC